MNISNVFDAGNFELLGEDKSFDFDFHTGEIQGTKCLLISNRSKTKNGDFFSRTSLLQSLLKICAKEMTPIIWCLVGDEIADCDTLKVPGIYPDAFVGNVSVGSLFHAIAELPADLLQVSVVSRAVTSSAAIVSSFSNAIIMVEGAILSVGRTMAVDKICGSKSKGLEAIAGVATHKKSGMCTLIAKNSDDVQLSIKSLLGCMNGKYSFDVNQELAKCGIPTAVTTPFNMSIFPDSIADFESLVPLWTEYSKEIVILTARFGGKSCLLIGNNSAEKGGLLYCGSLKKIRKGLRLASSLKIPVIFLHDCGGLFPGKDEEALGILEECTKTLSAIAKFPNKIGSVVVRRSYSAGLFLMGGHHFAKDISLIQDSGRVSIYGPSLISEMKSKNSDEPTNTKLEIMTKIHDSPSAAVEAGAAKECVSADMIRDRLINFLKN